MAHYGHPIRYPGSYSTSEDLSEIPLAKMSRRSTASLHDSSHQSPFLSPPATPIDKAETPFRAHQEDYFSLTQRKHRKSRQAPSLISHADPYTGGPPSMTYPVSTSVPVTAYEFENTVRHQNNTPAGSDHEHRRMSRSVAEQSEDILQSIEDVDSSLLLSSGSSTKSPTTRTRSRTITKASSVVKPSSIQVERQDPTQPTLVKAIGQAMTGLLSLSKVVVRNAEERQLGPKDTPAMITLRRASVQYNIDTSSRRNSNGLSIKSGFPGLKRIQEHRASCSEAATRSIVHPLLKCAVTQKACMKKSADPALTLVDAYGIFTGPDDTPDSPATRRTSTIAVIKTRQGSLEIIWRSDDTPSTRSVSTSTKKHSPKLRTTSPEERVDAV